MPTETPTEDLSGYRDQFLDRRKLFSDDDDLTAVAAELAGHLERNDLPALREALNRYYPADLADVLRRLPEPARVRLFSLLGAAEAAEVLDEVDPHTEQLLLRDLDPARVAALLSALPADEAADIVGALGGAQTEQALSQISTEKAGRIRELLAYRPDTAGGIMSTELCVVREQATVAETLQAFRQHPGADHLYYLYVVDGAGVLQGVLGLRALLLARLEQPVSLVMSREAVHVHSDMDQEQVAQIFARYDLMAVPVVDPKTHRLVGVITADDIIDVIKEEEAEDALHAVGSDAHELEQLPPTRIAMMRMPWIMATMFIELIAGFVIKGFDHTLARFFLLASFMPIISAISGNTGLQSATIIVRGLSTGHIRLDDWRHALARQVTTTLILGGSCGIVLGIIAAIWSRNPVFGAVVATGMFMSVNIAGCVGTVVPLISKRMGFDPALTAGPFETAFQDVVGISIFLTLATLMLNWLH